MAQVPLKFYKVENTYQLMPETSNKNAGALVVDPNEIKTAISWYRNMANERGGAEGSGLLKRLSDFQSGQSEFLINEQGNLATQKEVASQQAQQQSIASGQDTNISSNPSAPLTVPKGTPTPKGSNQQDSQNQQPIQLQTHVVQAGDSLSKIGAKYGVPWQSISGYKSGNPNLIFPGEVLKIPLASPQVPQTSQTNQTTTQEQSTATNPINASGDDLTTTVVENPDQKLTEYGLGSNFGTVSIDDMIKKVSQTFGIEGVNTELQELDDSYADNIQDINDNPWISEGLRSKKIASEQSKYESRKNALVERLRLQNDVVGKVIDLYQSEKQLQQNLTLKAVDLKQRQVEESNRILEADREFNENVRQFGLEYALKQQEMKEDLTKEDSNDIDIYQDRTNQRIIDAVDELIPRVNNYTAGLGGLSSFLPGSPAANFAADLSTLKSNIAQSTLKAMRDASKTGGALGQVSDREITLLENSLGALTQTQSPENLIKNLNKIKEGIERWDNAVSQHSGNSVGKNNDPLGIR